MCYSDKALSGVLKGLFRDFGFRFDVITMLVMVGPLVSQPYLRATLAAVSKDRGAIRKEV